MHKQKKGGGFGPPFVRALMLTNMTVTNRRNSLVDRPSFGARSGLANGIAVSHLHVVLGENAQPSINQQANKTSVYGTELEVS